MNIRSFSLLTLLVVSSAQSMEPKEGVFSNWLKSAQNLTAYVQSMQEVQDISNSLVKAKNTSIEFVMKNRCTIAAIGATATITAAATAYLCSKKCVEKVSADKSQTAIPASENLSAAASIVAPECACKKEVPNQHQNTVVKPVIEPGETVDVSNDSDYEFSIEVKIPARTYALLHMTKQISVVKK